MQHINTLSHLDEARLRSADGTVSIVKFGASWCKPCNALAPHFLAVAQRTSSVLATFYERDVGDDIEECEVASSLGVTSIPAFVVFAWGRQVGSVALGEAGLRSIIEMHCPRVSVAVVDVDTPSRLLEELSTHAAVDLRLVWYYGARRAETGESWCSDCVAMQPAFDRALTECVLAHRHALVDVARIKRLNAAVAPAEEAEASVEASAEAATTGVCSIVDEGSIRITLIRCSVKRAPYKAKGYTLATDARSQLRAVPQLSRWLRNEASPSASLVEGECDSRAALEWLLCARPLPSAAVLLASVVADSEALPVGDNILGPLPLESVVRQALAATTSRRALAPKLFIGGSVSGVGKSTIALSLLGSLLRRGFAASEIAYIKPATQCEAPQLVSKWCAANGVACVGVGPLVYFTGMTRRFLSGELGETSASLLARTTAAVDELASDPRIRLVVVDGVGYSAVGSIVGTSNADVARAMGAAALVVCPAGVGNACDQFTLNATLFEMSGVRVLGALCNRFNADPAHYYCAAKCAAPIGTFFERRAARHGVQAKLYGLLSDLTAATAVTAEGVGEGAAAEKATTTTLPGCLPLSAADAAEAERFIAAFDHTVDVTQLVVDAAAAAAMPPPCVPLNAALLPSALPFAAARTAAAVAAVSVAPPQKRIRRDGAGGG